MNNNDQKTNQLSRMLPSFLIIGTQKGGTTSLYHYIVKHPNIIAATKKEVHFFDNNFEEGISWYKDHFPFTNNNNPHAITGEASPRYLFDPLVPKRVFEYLPSVKLIVLLRNPVDRAYSHYQMAVRNGDEKRSFENTIIQEKEKILNKSEQSHNNLDLFTSYLSRGIYIEQLSRWMDLFPKKQMHIIKSEDFFENPKRITKEVIQFLTLAGDGLKIKKFKKINRGSYNEMDNKVKQELIEFFKPFNHQLEEALGMKFNWNE